MQNIFVAKNEKKTTITQKMSKENYKKKLRRNISLIEKNKNY